jgi:hypothetical protein
LAYHARHCIGSHLYILTCSPRISRVNFRGRHWPINAPDVWITCLPRFPRIIEACCFFLVREEMRYALSGFRHVWGSHLSAFQWCYLGGVPTKTPLWVVIVWCFHLPSPQTAGLLIGDVDPVVVCSLGVYRCQSSEFILSFVLVFLFSISTVFVLHHRASKSSIFFPHVFGGFCFITV